LIKKFPLLAVIATGGIFFTAAYTNFLGPKLLVFQLIILLLSLWFAISLFQTGTLSLCLHPIPFCALFYLFFTLLASSHNPTPFWGQQETLQIIVGILFLFLVWLIPMEKKDLEFSLTLLEFFAVPLILYGVLQHFNLDPFQWQAGKGRIFSFIGNADFFANYLAILISLSLARFLRKPNLLRPVLLLAEGTTLVWSYTRSPYLGLMISFFLSFVILTQKRGWKKTLLPFAGMALAGLVFFTFLFYFSHSFEKRFYFFKMWQSHDWQARVYFFKKGLEVLAFYPWGVGPGNFSQAYPPFRQDEPYFLRDRLAIPGSTHNEFLDAFVSTGILGGISYFSLWLLALAFLFLKALNPISDEADDAIPLFLPLLTAFFTLQFIFLDISTLALTFFLIGSIKVFVKEEKQITIPWINRTVLFAATLLFCFLWTYHAVRIFVAECYGGKARIAYTEKLYEKSAYLFAKAAKWNPWNPVLDQFAGKSYEFLGKAPQALKYYSKAILKEGNNPYFWADLGRLAGKIGLKKMALEAYQTATSLDPYNPFFLHDAAYTAFRFGDFRLALFWGKQAFALNPNDPSTIFYMAESYIQLGEMQKAKALVVKESPKFPKNPIFLTLKKEIH
jgi:tetratricopeptide (TPR) repeat protein